MEDIKQYIESGILELYVLDNLTPEEKLDVERYAISYPEIQKELNEISAAIESFAELNAIEPNENLRSTILNQLEYSVTESKPGYTSFEDRKIIPLKNTRQTNFYKYAFAASLALFLTTGIALFNVYNRLQDSKQQLVALQQQNQKFANQVNFQESELNQYKKKSGAPVIQPSFIDSNAVKGDNSQQIIARQKASLKESQKEILALERQNKTREKVFEIFSDPASRFIKLKGVKDSSKLLIAWNPDKKQLWINKKASALPVNDKDHQYQLWAIRKLKPISLGVFDIRKTDSIMENMSSIDRASAFAVTLEPRGGSEKPTLKEMVVMGLNHK